jgi:hypothetical protein
MLSAVTRSATFLSASCYLFSPQWIGKTKDCFPSLCCKESNTLEITLSVLLAGSLNKVQKTVSIIFVHFQLKWKQVQGERPYLRHQWQMGQEAATQFDTPPRHEAYRGVRVLFHSILAICEGYFSTSRPALLYPRRMRRR